ncbi:hypothetical protein [Lyngbya sp. CCY1209]|uniref:hypothetical protein n=1 Tax=Lyngbya sp. CCY1209 TaxID=2886103 RepID=UPI002D214CFD|nr:hypothetical protein [Lyngbya sp. CCY1209]MEB3883013.1 hypothetical protein [Lyngbya sp. CCY1209]
MPRPNQNHTHQTHNRPTVFLTMTLEPNPSRDNKIKQIELIGVPGEMQGGQYIVSDTTYSFMDANISRPIFSKSRRMSHLNWQKLKIWLVDSTNDNGSFDYQIPTVDHRDFEIKSNSPESALKGIYVLDNELQGLEYRHWQQTARSLFQPLFKNFVPPPQFPLFSLDKSPLYAWTESMEAQLDPYAKMKRSLFFDHLIIQVD